MPYSFLDDENSKEIYSIASELEQAKILHKSFVTMLRQEPDLLEQVHITKQPAKVLKMNGAFTDEYEALSSTSDSKDGKRPSTVFIDEGHAHKSKELYSIMVDGLSGRQQPLEIHLSTAGHNMQGYFYTDIYQYFKKVKDGIIKDDTAYSVMFELSEEDKQQPDFWKDPKMWAKANPNFPRSPTLGYMQGKILQAEQSAQSLNSFLTKNLNCWVDKPDVWLENKVWTQNQSPIDLEKLKGKPCYGGLDLAQTRDLAAFVLIFPDDSLGYRRYDILCRFWIPKDNMFQRIKRDKVPYFDFIQDGLITATEGNSIDYKYIENQILQDCADYDVKQIAYDRYMSTSIIQTLSKADCTTLIPYNQTTVWFNAPVIELETLAHQGRLNHQNNKVLNWHCSNVVIFRDSSGNVKFDKDKSIEKIDGMVALAMAMGVATKDMETEEDNSSTYNERGMLDI